MAHFDRKLRCAFFFFFFGWEGRGVGLIVYLINKEEEENLIHISQFVWHFIIFLNYIDIFFWPFRRYSTSKFYFSHQRWLITLYVTQGFVSVTRTHLLKNKITTSHKKLINYNGQTWRRTCICRQLMGLQRGCVWLVAVLA